MASLTFSENTTATAYSEEPAISYSKV